MKRISLRTLVSSLATLALVACGGPTTNVDEMQRVHETEAAAPVTLDLGHDVKVSAAGGGKGDNGTALSATASAGEVTCTSPEGGSVTVSGVLTTTGAVDSAEIRVSVDGGASTLRGIIQPRDFVHDGRYKNAAYSLDFDLSNGTHTISVCFVQSGSQGREPKQVCAAPVTVVVDCAPPPENICSGVGFFGDIVGNGNLCNGNGPPHIPVHAKGDLGEAPVLTISGPNGFSHSATMRHAGESCVYQYNWNTAGNGGAGPYVFTVTGNGNTFTWTKNLSCR